MNRNFIIISNLSWNNDSPAAAGLVSLSVIVGSSPTITKKNTRHLLTICTQKATRFDKGSCRSRCCGQAGNSLSCPALSWTSLLDSRAKHGNDRGEEKNTEKTEEKKRTREWQERIKIWEWQYYFLLSSSDKRSAFRGSLDIRITRSAWRYGWMSGASPNMTERKISPGMTIFFSYA